MVKDEFTVQLLQMVPLKTDFEEAQSTHELLLQQILAKHEALFKHPAEIKAALQRIQEFAAAHPEKEEDILGDDGRALLQQVLS